jgi:hypothetical protein
MRARHVSVDESESNIRTNIRARSQPPATARPEPPDAFVSLDPEFRLQDVQLFGGFVLLVGFAVVKSVVAISESLQFEELKAGRGIVFAVCSVGTRNKLVARTFVARSGFDFPGVLEIFVILATLVAVGKGSVKLRGTD